MHRENILKTNNGKYVFKGSPQILVLYRVFHFVINITGLLLTNLPSWAKMVEFRKN